MRRVTACKLKCGDEIIYGDKIVFARDEYDPEYAGIGLEYPVNPRRGIVEKVTDKGGVLVKVTAAPYNRHVGWREWTSHQYIFHPTGRIFRLFGGEWKQHRQADHSLRNIERQHLKLYPERNRG